MYLTNVLTFELLIYTVIAFLCSIGTAMFLGGLIFLQESDKYIEYDE